MKKLHPFFKKLSWLFLVDASVLNDQREIVEFQLSCYEDIFIRDIPPKNVREALDAIDLIVLFERNDLYFAEWHRMAELYQACMTYLRANTALFEDPIFGQGRFEENRIRARYEHKKRVLFAFAKRNGIILV